MFFTSENFRTIASILLVGSCLAGPAMAGSGEDQLNNMISGGGSSGTTVVVPATTETPGNSADSVAVPDDTGKLAGGERWVKHASAIKHVQLLSGRPLPNESCRNVIFDARPSLKKRHKLEVGQKLRLKIKDLCLIGFRNDAEDRSLVVRLGEAFETLAIVLDPKLFTGYVIAPGQQITIPLRQLPVPAMDVSVEVAWEADLEAAEPKVDSTTLSLVRDN
jgi:hypothetical protein